MKIGIIGTGKMGGTLGKLWAEHGHEVMFGSRDPEKARAFAAEVGAETQGGSQADAAQFGEIVLLAVPGGNALGVASTLPLDGKILIDINNPIADGMTLAMGHETSLAEEIAKAAPGATVIKAFNAMHFKVLEESDYNGEVPSVFYCGDDATAKAKVKMLIEQLGFDAFDAGPLEHARYLEPLAMLWIRLAFREGRGDSFNFKAIYR